MLANYFLISSLLLVLFSRGESFIITVDAHAEECFFDRITSGTKMHFMFEVAEGGFLDIDVKVVGPDANDLYTGARESNGKYKFAAHMDGVYRYCFSNKMSTVTPKVVMFSMDVIFRPNTTVDKKADENSHSKLEEMVTELTTSLQGVKQEQEYMELRERVHKAINDNTNSRVVLWSCFEAFVLVFMTLGQVYYLRRFFEVRRVV